MTDDAMPQTQRLVVETLADLEKQVGREFGPTEWFAVDQALIDAFAEVTGDRNWYHVDQPRAAREIPGGRTIAHGLLTLSLIPSLAGRLLEVRRHGRAFNYGFDRVRFPAPVSAGDRICLRMKILSVEPQNGGRLIRRQYTIDIEGGTKPAVVAQMLTLIPDPTASAEESPAA